jgi:pimeloyl-ACP methyl ester carboxylesterase
MLSVGSAREPHKEGLDLAASRRLLLIHGFVCDARFWGPQVAALESAGHGLLVPDLPYHGGPTAGVEKSLQGLARWVSDTHLRKPSVLIGHSLGGMIALQIAHDQPQSVAALVLVDSFASLELNSRYLDGLYSQDDYKDVRQWIEETRRGILERMTREVEGTIWPSVAAFDARPWLPDLRCPLLGIYGGRGRYRTEDAPRLRNELELDRTAGPSSVTVVPEAGHFVNLEEPDVVNAALTAWLAKLPA